LFDRAKVTRIDLENLREKGLLHIEQVDAAELISGEFAHRAGNRVGKSLAKTVIIYSLNGYQFAMLEENFLVWYIHERLQYLNRQGANMVLTFEQHGLVCKMKAPIDLTYLADAVVPLRYFESSGKARRAVSIIKKRTGAHEDTFRLFEIGSTGLSVGQLLDQFQRILRGVPDFVGKLPPSEKNNGGTNSKLNFPKSSYLRAQGQRRSDGGAFVAV
jgi:circadian clock protein KaiC